MMVHFFKGKEKRGSCWYLLQGEDIVDLNRRNQSIYGNEESGTDHLNGLRVRITFTMNATGMLAATFITVTGLTERELPKEGCPSGVLHIAIKGLCVGAAQDLRHDAIGYLTLYRREKCKVTQTTAEQRNFPFYRKEVLLPCIALVRENIYGLKKGDPVPDALTAVSWSDGAAVQFNTIADERQQEMDSELKILSNKQSASRTVVK